MREKERREIKRTIKPRPGRRKAAGTANSGEIGAINTQRPNFALPARRRPSITRLRVEEGGVEPYEVDRNVGYIVYTRGSTRGVLNGES